MADLNYFDAGYFTPSKGYYVYTAEASANLAIQTNLTVNQRIDNIGRANLTVRATIYPLATANYLGATGRTPTTQTGLKTNLAGIEFYG